VEDIDRIEIVKGSQSTMYGSEAMAGVINIITKKGTGKLRLDASVEGGSFGTFLPSLAVSGSEGPFTYRVTGLYSHTDGISAAKSGSEKDSYDNGYASWHLGAKPTSNSEVELFGNYSRDRTELDGFDFFTGAAVDALNFVQHGSHFLFAGRGKLYLFDKWEQVLTASYLDHEVKSRDPETDFNNSDVFTKRFVVDWQHNLYLSRMITVTAGLEYRQDRGENVGNYKDTIDNKAAYLNATLKLLGENLRLNAGLRYDDHETAGSKTTYRIGASYLFKEADLTVRASYGTGFLAPSFDFLFFKPFDNPNLKPEESKSFEIQAVKTFMKDRVSLSLSYFKTDYTNLIQGDPATNFKPGNIAKASVSGIEATAFFRIADGLDLQAGYTYLDSEDELTGSRLVRRPNNKLTAGVSYTKGNLSLLADVVYVGEAVEFDQSVIAPYTVVNLSGTYKISEQFTVFGRIANLFDEDYEEVKGFGTKGFSAYGGLRVRL
jgi:vitamin B12 transporter